MARNVYDSGTLAGRTAFVNVMTNQMNTGLPMRNDDSKYLNADGDFDLRCLVDLMKDTSDLRGAVLPENPFASTPYCREDMHLVSSIIMNWQQRHRHAIEEDDNLAKAVITDKVDTFHTIILAARKLYGMPVDTISMELEHEQAQVKILCAIRGKRRDVMGDFICEKVKG